MKTRNLALAVVALLFTQAVSAQKAEVDTKASSIEWHGKKVGGDHSGNINLKNGYLELKDGNITAGSFVVDMTSISNSDLKDEGYNQKLVGHLKSDDFFGVESYPTAKFVVTKSSAFKADKASLTGNITIKGKTESITFDVHRSGKKYSAKIDLDRSKFDVRYGSNSFFDNLGDKAINDIFNLKIDLVLQ